MRASGDGVRAGRMSVLARSASVDRKLAQPRSSSSDRGEPLGQFMIMAGFRYFVAAMRLTGIIQCDLRSLDVLRRSGPVVIAPNHPSLLDAVLIISRLPRVVCAAKSEIWDNLFLGAGVRLAGYVRNDSPAALIRHA